jgi:hypothetical protein
MVSIVAPTIIVDVGGTLTASTLTLGGGALQVTSGTTVIKGVTSRSRGTVGS